MSDAREDAEKVRRYEWIAGAISDLADGRPLDDVWQEVVGIVMPIPDLNNDPDSAEFAWLAAHDRRIKAESWDEAIVWAENAAAAQGWNDAGVAASVIANSGPAANPYRESSTRIGGDGE